MGRGGGRNNHELRCMLIFKFHITIFFLFINSVTKNVIISFQSVSFIIRHNKNGYIKLATEIVRISLLCIVIKRKQKRKLRASSCFAFLHNNCFVINYDHKDTVMILSFPTDIPGQTVQTQIRLL